jgi:hypothetical protein
MKCDNATKFYRKPGDPDFQRHQVLQEKPGEPRTGFPIHCFEYANGRCPPGERRDAWDAKLYATVSGAMRKLTARFSWKAVS